MIASGLIASARSGLLSLRKMEDWHRADMFITIRNNGADIVYTNYWQTAQAAAGAFYLSFNAGSARLLIPASMESQIAEMHGASEVIISRGFMSSQLALGLMLDESLEIMWEDGSNAPYAIHMSTKQCDRLLPKSDHGASIPLSVWTEAGKAAEWPGRYRIVKELPCLQPWKSNHES